MKNWEERKRGEAVIYRSLKVGPINITVHHDINSSPSIWFLSCGCLNLYNVQLASKDLDEACCQARAKVQVILESALKDICDGYNL